MINIPTTTELYDRISTNLRNRLGLANVAFKKVLNAITSVIAGESKLLYLYLSDIQRNLNIETADSELIGGTLERFGRLYLNRDPNPATQGKFQVTVTGDIGSVIPSNTGFKSDSVSKNQGKLYYIESDYTLLGANDSFEIISEGGGSEFDLNINDTLTLTSPIIGVDNTITVSIVNEQPFDKEDLDDYKSDIIRALQLEAQGGSKTDYRLWSADQGGVRQVYPYLKDNDGGTVQVFVEANKSDSTDSNGTPSQAILDGVVDVINFNPDESKPTEERGRRPIQANLEVLTINTVPVDVTITGLLDRGSDIQTSIFDNMDVYLDTVRPFIDGADLLRNKNDILYISGLQSAVVAVLTDGNSFTGFQMFVNSTEKTSHLFYKENIPYLRNVTYV